MLVANKPRQHSLLQKGFTLVELMIVVVIVGILSAIALPNFLNQQNKAKAACAKTQVSGFAKEQQVHFAEKSTFAESFQALGYANDFTPSDCSGNYTIKLDNTKIQADPKDTNNGLCVTATLENGSYLMGETKGACPQ
ncbi:type IV pilin protein [Synechococcus sp. NB0720_010]|uniref:type IV pilin protein n=1 Tax=Synechococcus sp. NB0720_010 TaxID=2907159 RepID=UPI002739AB6C|nr:type II secretion system protein [Synechococcus sp. NB0720_010]